MSETETVVETVVGIVVVVVIGIVVVVVIGIVVDWMRSVG